VVILFGSNASANPASRIEDVKKSELTPKKAFIIAALDKEIRLSFAKRIRETLPQEYHHIITEGKFKDVPDYKYNSERTYHINEFIAPMLTSAKRLHILQKVAKFWHSSERRHLKLRSNHSSMPSTNRLPNMVSLILSSPPQMHT
jgi:hypothetical protein